MPLSIARGADVAGTEDHFLAVVIEHGLALDDVIELRLMVVGVISNGTARVHYSMGKQTTMSIQSFLIRQSGTPDMAAIDVVQSLFPDKQIDFVDGYDKGTIQLIDCGDASGIY